MKKLILYSVAFLGLFGGVVAPAQAQILVNSTPRGGSITGAASFTNFNGSTSAVAGEVTFPGNTYAVEVVVTSTISGNGINGAARLTGLTVATSDPATKIVTNPATNTTSVEAAVASAITGTAATTLNERVSLIRAWTSGGLN